MLSGVKEYFRHLQKHGYRRNFFDWNLLSHLHSGRHLSQPKMKLGNTKF